MAMDDSGRTGLVAVSREIQPLVENLHQEGYERCGASILYTGTIGRRPVALAEVPIGPVNGALGAQALIVRHGVRTLISFGSAGALGDELSPGDLVIARRAIAHDAGTFLGHRFDPTGVMGRDEQGEVGFRRAFDADPDLVARAQAAARTLGVTARAGTIVTGNQTIFATARKRWLRQTFDALAVEMETAAVAQVAEAYGLPWVAVRAVSDSAGDDMTLDFHRLRRYLDDGRPAWRYWLDLWVYLLTHPTARRRLQRLRHGLALATEQAGRLAEAMLRA